MKKNKCIITEEYCFLWWKWTETSTDHEWAYKNKEERKCLKCGLEEILIGERHYNGYLHKDWGTKL